MWKNAHAHAGNRSQTRTQDATTGSSKAPRHVLLSNPPRTVTKNVWTRFRVDFSCIVHVKACLELEFFLKSRLPFSLRLLVWSHHRLLLTTLRTSVEKPKVILRQ